MTKERLDLDEVEEFVSRCNTPYNVTRCNTPHVPHASHWSRDTRTPTLSLSRPMSVITDGEDLNSSFSHSNSSCSPPLHRDTVTRDLGVHSSQGGVYTTLFRPDLVTTRVNPRVNQSQSTSKLSDTTRINNRHSSYISVPLITIDTGTPSPGE